MPTLTQSQIKMYAQAAGLTPADKWAAIAMAESGGRTDVVNSIGCVGLWQINQPVHVKNHPSWTVKYLQDPANNARAAKIIAGSQGLSAWEAYTGPDGVGSDGPWKQYANASDLPGFDLVSPWIDPWGLGSDGIPNPFGDGSLTDSLPGAAEIGQIADVVTSAAKWVSTPYNWVRIGYVLGGAILVYAGISYVIQSTITSKVSSSPISSVIPGGSLLKGKSSGKRTSAKRTGSSSSRSRKPADDSSGKSPTD